MGELLSLIISLLFVAMVISVGIEILKLGFELVVGLLFGVVSAVGWVFETIFDG